MKKILLTLLFPFLVFGQTQLGNNINGETAGDYFGDRVAISFDGLVLVSGSKFSDHNALDSGGVTVYRYTGGSWVQVGSRFYGQTHTERVGSSIAVSSDGIQLHFRHLETV